MEKIIVRIDAELKEIVPGFLEKKRTEAERMRGLLEAHDFATLQILGHRLKGNAGGYGFEQMGFIGSEIEQAAIDKDEKKMKESLTELERYLSQIEIVFG